MKSEDVLVDDGRDSEAVAGQQNCATDSGAVAVGSPAAECCQPSSSRSELEQLARVAQALSDPIRLEMIEIMAQGRACCELPEPASRGVPGSGDPRGICVCEFQEQFGLGQSKVSYHLRVLREAGLMRAETRGKWSFYSVDRDAVAEALHRLHRLLGA